MALLETSPPSPSQMNRSGLAFFLWALACGTLMLVLNGCMSGYLLKSAYHQEKLMKARRPIPSVIESKTLTEDEKRKLLLATEAKFFGETKMDLKKTDNYSTYVKLDRPYVSYVVRAAPIYELEAYLWWFPLVGRLPYKGYFSEKEAQAEAKTFDPSKFDTWVGGASAYSTLGWFSDPVLSSMLKYKDHDLVNLILHESVHATLYIKSNADFNERLATFLGDKGTLLFYEEREGPGGKTLKDIEVDIRDTELFSKFISRELDELKLWYKSQTPTLETKKQRLQDIKIRFASKVKPELKGEQYSQFEKMELNNASLLSLSTYMGDLQDFEALYLKMDKDLKKFLRYCRSLEDSKDPVGELKNHIQRLNSGP